MQKIKKLMMVSCLFLGVILMSACQKNQSDYEQSMQKADEAISDKKFEKAEGFVELALESKQKDEVAKNYQIQLKNYQEGLKLQKANKSKEANEEFSKVIKVKKGSDKLVEYAKKEIQNTSKATNETSKKIVDKENKKEAKNAMWTKEKERALSEFMVGWGESMGQTYQSYTMDNNVDFYGVQAPKDILDKKMQMAVNEQPVSVAWSEDGNGKADYNLVAVYSDAETQPYLEKHLYFFVFKEEQPYVMITEQNQGNSENYLHFKETASTDLTNGFVSIIKGEKAAIPEKQASHFDAETTSALNTLKGTYYENGGESPIFSIDDEFYHDLVKEKDYPLSSINKNEQGVYNIAWDIEKFEQTYGPRSAGPGPQPFMYKVISDSNGTVLEDLGGKTYTQK